MGKKGRRNQEAETAADSCGNEGKSTADAPQQIQLRKQVDIILGTYIHCNGCADKIIKCLRGFDGVQEISVNSKEHKVMVKGTEEADPSKITERVRQKYSKYVDLISPIVKHCPPMQTTKQDEANEPMVIIVTIQIFIHCHKCAEDTKRCLQRMQGVQMVRADVSNSQMIVRGIFYPPKLVDFLYRRAGKYATIVKQEYQDATKRRAIVKSSTSKEGNEKENAASDKKEQKEFYFHYPPHYGPKYIYPCEILNEENANACIVM